MYILETERLILHRFALTDLDEIYRLVYADPSVKDTWSDVTSTPDEIKKRFTDKYIQPEGHFGRASRSSNLSSPLSPPAQHPTCLWGI